MTMRWTHAVAGLTLAAGTDHDRLPGRRRGHHRHIALFPAAHHDHSDHAGRLACWLAGWEKCWSAHVDGRRGFIACDLLEKADVPPMIRSSLFPRVRVQIRHDAFTLIELLTVIAIILVLAGLLLHIAGSANYKSSLARAQAEIQAISTALESYKADNGTYPRNSDH